MDKNKLQAYLQDALYNKNGFLIFKDNKTEEHSTEQLKSFLIANSMIEKEIEASIKKPKGDRKKELIINEEAVSKKLKILKFHLENKLSKLRSSYGLPTSEKYKKENIEKITVTWKEAAQDVIEEIVKVYQNNDSTRERGTLIMELLNTFNIDKEWLSYNEEEEDFVN